MRALAVALALLVLAPTALAAKADLDVPGLTKKAKPAKLHPGAAPAAPPTAHVPRATALPEADVRNAARDALAVVPADAREALAPLRLLTDPHGAKVERLEREAAAPLVRARATAAPDVERVMAAPTLARGTERAAAPAPSLASAPPASGSPASASPAEVVERAGDADMTLRAAAAAGAILVLGLAPLLLYHRAKGAGLAAQATRARLLAALHERPGLSRSQLAREVGVDPSTALYHLRRLEKDALVAVERDAGAAFYFPAGMLAPAERARAIAARRAAPVLDAVREAPGQSQTSLVARLAISRATLAWHLARLQRAGLVRKERDGREVKVYPATPQETFS